MSQLKVDTITDEEGTGAPAFPNGIESAGTLALSATGANVITASTNGVERMRIDSAGNVGIGTSSPSAKLHVRTSPGRDFKVDQSIENQTTLSNDFALSVAANAGFDLLLRSNGTNDFGNIRLFTNNTERLRITSAGNVGIGKTNPSSRLDVSTDFERISVDFTAGGTVDIQLPNGAVANFIVLMVHNLSVQNGRFNHSRVLLMNPRVPGFGGGAVDLISTAHGSTGVTGEPTNVTTTYVDGGILRVGASVVGGASNTLRVSLRLISLA